MPTVQLESEFDRLEVKPFLEAFGPKIWHQRMWMIAHLGLPDRIACLSGTFIALEVKRSREEATKMGGRAVLQRLIIHRINDAGGYARMVYPENWEIIKDELQRIAHGKKPGELESRALPVRH